MRLIKNTIFASLGLFGISCISIELFRLYLPELLNTAIKEILSNNLRIKNSVKKRSTSQNLAHNVYGNYKQHPISAYNETVIFTSKLFKEIINENEIFDTIVRYYFKSMTSPFFELILEDTAIKIVNSNLIVDSIRDIIRGSGRYEKFDRKRLAINRLRFNTKWKSYKANVFLIPIPPPNKDPLRQFKKQNLNIVENIMQSEYIKELCLDLSNNLLDQITTFKENNEHK